MRAVTGGRAAVIDLAHAFVAADHQPERVIVRAAVVELPGSCCSFTNAASPTIGVVKFSFHFKQIADRGQQAAVAVDVLERHVDVKAVALRRCRQSRGP